MTTPDPFAPGYRLTDGNQLNLQIANPQWSTSAALTATSGGTLYTSAKAYNTITNVTAATTGAGIAIPQALAGRVLVIVNNSSNDIRVFAAGNSTIDGLAGVIGVLQGAQTACMYVATADFAWEQFGFISSGAGIFTPGSVIFAGDAGQLAQDNAHFFWNESTKYLHINGTAEFVNLNNEGVITTNDNIGRDLMVGKQSIATLIGYAGSAAMIQGSNFNQSANNPLSLQPYGGYVGIGITNPSALLYLNDPTDDSGPDAVRMIIRAGTGAGTAYSGIRFQMRDHTTGWGCDIQAFDDTSAAGGALRFRTGSGVTTVPTEAMRISSARNVGIGNTNPQQLLSVGANGGTNGAIGLSGSTSGVVTVKPQAAAGTYNFNLPTTSGTAGQVLASGGGGASPMTWLALEPVSVSVYGADNTGATNCAAAFTAANAAPSILIPSGTYLVSSNVTFTKHVTILEGAVLNIATGVTVTFNNGMSADRYQIFNPTGTGKVVFNEEYLTTGFPEWWGAQVGGFDCYSAISACIIACPITSLGVGAYFINTTLKMQTTGRILRGTNSGFQVGSDSRIVMNDSAQTIIQIGPDTYPAGGINDFLRSTRIEYVYMVRSPAPSIPANATGLRIQWSLFTYVENCQISENIYGIDLSGTVQTHLTNLIVFRSSAGIGGGTDAFYGVYFNGNATLPAAGGNASTYVTDVSVSIGGLPSLAASNSRGFVLAFAGADTFLLRPETTSLAVGIEVYGSTGHPKTKVGDADIHIIGAVCDAFSQWGLRLSGCDEYSSISIMDGYFAPAGGAAASAGIGIDTCIGAISLTNNQVIGWPGISCQGLYVTGSSGVNAEGNIYTACKGGAVYITGSSMCRIEDTCQNETAYASGNAAVTLVSSNRCYIAPIIKGNTNVWASGINLSGAGNTYVEANVTTILPTAITGGANNKLLYNATQITAVGVFPAAGTNYCSGCVG